MRQDPKEMSQKIGILQAHAIMKVATGHEGMVRVWSDQAVAGKADYGMLRSLDARYADFFGDMPEAQRKLDAGEPFNTTAAELGLTPSEMSDLLQAYTNQGENA